MSWTYSCPKCKGVVNPDETVILIAVCPEYRFLIGIHPQPGNYTVYLPPGVELVQGARYEFVCPLCRENLESPQHENLSMLEVWQGDLRRIVLFSNIAGERATYIVKDDALEENHGEHADHYRDNIH